MSILANKYLLIVTYDVEYCPTIDLPVLNALEETIFDLDLIRDDNIRQICMYFSSKEEMEQAEELLILNASQRFEDSDYCLLDLIKIKSTKINRQEEEKLILRNRIAEIYRRQIEVKWMK